MSGGKRSGALPRTGAGKGQGGAPAGAAVAGPRLSHAGQLVWAYEEDPVGAAFDAVRAAGWVDGATCSTDLDLPPWWWAATGLRRDDGAPRLVLAKTDVGPVVVAGGRGAAVGDEAGRAAHRLLARATSIDAAAHARLMAARDPTPRESDFPLGAYVAPARHDEVLVERLRAGGGVVASWTRVAEGAAPSEFTRLQEAHGAYHVVLVRREGGGGTVGLWTGSPPAVGMPCEAIVRVLFAQQGATRHGCWFRPREPRL